jgi:hypothetical protein
MITKTFLTEKKDFEKIFDTHKILLKCCFSINNLPILIVDCTRKNTKYTIKKKQNKTISSYRNVIYLTNNKRSSNKNNHHQSLLLLAKSQ